MGKFLLGALLLSSLAYGQADGDWRTYRNKAGGYEAAFPIPPRAEKVKITCSAGTYSLDLNSVSAKEAFMGVASTPLSKGKEKAMIEGAIKTFGGNGKILRQDNIKFHEEPAQIMIVQKGPKAFLEAMIFARPGRMVIALATATSTRELGAKHFFQFFDSFKLLPAK